MNWLRPDYPYTEIYCPENLSYNVENTRKGDIYHTSIQFINRSKWPIFTSIGEIGIYFPLEGRYDRSDICLRYRCHTHIFCGGNISYIIALRMGGEAPHLGMVLTEGSLAAYSIERNPENKSNDRGCFILHPSPMELEPGESKYIQWTIFPHSGKNDFIRQVSKLAAFVLVKAEQYVLHPGEDNRIMIMPSFKAKSVQIDGKPLAQDKYGNYVKKYTAEQTGEKTFSVSVDGVHTFCRTFVQEDFLELAGARCRFIASHQQYKGAYPALKGAYLVYDNEEHHIFYSHVNDYNAGRERVGMGLLIAAYLQTKKQSDKDFIPFQSGEGKMLDYSLKQYIAFVEREIVNKETGEVCNDFGHDNSYHRLYNYTWYATFFIECYRLYEKISFLKTACNILSKFYQSGGYSFYPIELPVILLDQALEKADMKVERVKIRDCFIRHADTIVKNDVHYPSQEVNYEQSIVAPAADILFQVYMLTKETKYLQAGKRQLHILELFNGEQPDYHLYETSIRHWDAYWFGKRKFFGDTFPHYWSALTGKVYALYAMISGNKKYAKRAQNSLRGILPLFFKDGTASCAYVFPYSINGKRASFYDPYANDQDWGLYYNLRILGNPALQMLIKGNFS